MTVIRVAKLSQRRKKQKVAIIFGPHGYGWEASKVHYTGPEEGEGCRWWAIVGPAQNEKFGFSRLTQPNIFIFGHSGTSANQRKTQKKGKREGTEKRKGKSGLPSPGKAKSSRRAGDGASIEKGDKGDEKERRTKKTKKKNSRKKIATAGSTDQKRQIVRSLRKKNRERERTSTNEKKGKEGGPQKKSRRDALEEI